MISGFNGKVTNFPRKLTKNRIIIIIYVVPENPAVPQNPVVPAVPVQFLFL